jgi:hypothetical protein
VYWSLAQLNANAEANKYQPHTKNHMNPSKTVIAGAAVAGLLTGSFAARTYAASTSHSPGVSLQTVADPEKQPLPKHACKGQNDCKGQGGCKSGGGPGKNSCKGKGGCATDGSKPPHS